MSWRMDDWAGIAKGIDDYLLDIPDDDDGVEELEEIEEDEE